MLIENIEVRKVFEGKKRFAVLVRASNEGPALHAFWASLERQTVFTDADVIFLVDGGSVDETLDFVMSKPCSVYEIRKGTFNYGRSCNQIFSLARSPVCFLFSGHVILERADTLEQGLVLLEEKRQTALYFRQVPNPVCGSNTYEKVFLKHKFPQGDVAERRLDPGSFSNAAAGYTLDSWKALPFKEIDGAEDLAWAEQFISSGGTLYYLPQSLVQHSHNDSAEKLYHRTRALVLSQGSRSWARATYLFAGIYLKMRRSGGSHDEAFRYAWAHASSYL